MIIGAHKSIDGSGLNAALAKPDHNQRTKSQKELLLMFLTSFFAALRNAHMQMADTTITFGTW